MIAVPLLTDYGALIDISPDYWLWGNDCCIPWLLIIRHWLTYPHYWLWGIDCCIPWHIPTSDYEALIDVSPDYWLWGTDWHIPCLLIMRHWLMYPLTTDYEALIDISLDYWLWGIDCCISCSAPFFCNWDSWEIYTEWEFLKLCQWA